MNENEINKRNNRLEGMCIDEEDENLLSDVFIEAKKNGSVLDDATTVQVQVHNSAMPEVKRLDGEELKDEKVDIESRKSVFDEKMDMLIDDKGLSALENIPRQSQKKQK